MKIQYDVIVIGAGFAGLAAAKSLSEAGMNIRVLEARSQVGGRVDSTILNSGERIDIGGTWITSIQSEILRLAQTYGVVLISTTPAGKDLGSAESIANDDLSKIISQLDQMAEDIDTREPWSTPLANDWDNHSFANWLKQNVSSPAMRRYLTEMTGQYFLCADENVSLLHALFYWKSNGGFDFVFGQSAQPSSQLRCHDSVHQLCLRLSDELGERISLNCPVRKIVQFKDYVSVSTDSTEFTASCVLIAMSPSASIHIIFEPDLEPFRTYLSGRLMKTSLYTFKLMYETPFWRDQGLSGTGFISEEGLETVDTSPQNDSYGVLTVYSCPHSFWRLVALNDIERKDFVLNTLSKHYGEAASRPVQYIEKTTVFDPFIRGCVTVFPPNTWSTFGASLRKPFGLVHWAGTETATEFAGQMEGAIRSGYRAAEEIRVALA